LEKSAQLKKQNSTIVEENQPKVKPNNNLQATPRVIKNPKTLSYKEEKELEGMEENILLAEEEVSSLEAIFADPDFYSKHGNNTAKLKEDLDAAKVKVEELYQRWEFLEQKKKGQL
jgi:ATP-binding cassette subfamily F protein uup